MMKARVKLGSGAAALVTSGLVAASMAGVASAPPAYAAGCSANPRGTVITPSPYTAYGIGSATCSRGYVACLTVVLYYNGRPATQASTQRCMQSVSVATPRINIARGSWNMWAVNKLSPIRLANP